MSLTTARALIDSARSRHWTFSSLALGDGAALLFLKSRLATHLATHGAQIEGLVGTTLEYAVPLAQPTLLVTTTGDIFATVYGQQFAVPGADATTSGANGGLGTPALGAAYQDGWAVHLTVDGVPYVDFSEPPIAADPFGDFGGTPGFALPADMIRLVNVALVLTNERVVPCDVVPEGQRFTTLPGRNPACFVNANRLIPVRPRASGNSGDRWATASRIQISYVGVQGLAALDDVLNLPTVLAEALIADLAQMLAMQAKDMPASDKPLFLAEARACGAAIAAASLDLLNAPMESAVHYRG